jgi:hypothetical protein
MLRCELNNSVCGCILLFVNCVLIKLNYVKCLDYSMYKFGLFTLIGGKHFFVIIIYIGCLIGGIF